MSTSLETLQVQPDMQVSVRTTFGIDSELMCAA
jgi:hypothetical protein